MENFITDPYRLAEFCEYSSLKGEMIRDRLVVGLRKDNFSEELQMNSDLTLEQPVQLWRAVCFKIIYEPVFIYRTNICTIFSLGISFAYHDLDISFPPAVVETLILIHC